MRQAHRTAANASQTLSRFCKDPERIAATLRR